MNNPSVCPLCVSNRSLVWGARGGLKIYKCQTCGLTYFDRSCLANTDYGHYYEYTHAWNHERVEYELGLRAKRYRRQLKKISELARGRRFLEIGAGPGYFCKIAAEAGWEAQAVEINASSRELGEKYFGIHYVELDDVVDKSIDVIGCFHIVEHVPDLRFFIKKLREKLKLGGLVVVHAPHQEPLSFRIRNLLLPRQSKKEKFCQLYPPEHISGFSESSLRNCFELFQFKTIRIFTRSMWSIYYDPFFIRNDLERRNYAGILKRCLRQSVDTLGAIFGCGDWLIGYFRTNE